MTAEEQIKAIFPNSWLEMMETGWEVWVEYFPEQYEVMGGGRTQEEAWENALSMSIVFKGWLDRL